MGAYNRFIIFPTEKIAISFGNDSKALECNTKEGMSIQIDVNLQYRIKPDFESVKKIFFDWGEDRHTEAFYLIARSELRSICATFEATSFIYDKTCNKSDNVSYFGGNEYSTED